jgi:hypothetical protein
MRSSRRALVLGVLATCAIASRAEAQQQAQGFAVERFYPSAPGGGWFVMDDLDLHGRLGGAMEMTGGYARNPLKITSGSQMLPVVSDEAFVDFGFAATYERWRLYLNMPAPVLVNGDSGIIGKYQFSTPTGPGTAHFVDLGSDPDTLSDARVGLDARIVGEPESPFRLGVGAQLLIPSGFRTQYITDDTYRAMGRLLVAGDIGMFMYAAQVGVHIRPLDDAPTPGSPQGSELLFGGAAGVVFPVMKEVRFVVGPEVWGATAFRSFFGTSTTALEGILGARFEGTGTDGPQLRFKLGPGLGINEAFGTPDWRVLLAVEVFTHNADRDGDGISDSKDACPDRAGPKTEDVKTNGCPP